jgi:hypothetical protein
MLYKFSNLPFLIVVNINYKVFDIEFCLIILEFCSAFTVITGQYLYAGFAFMIEFLYIKWYNVLHIILLSLTKHIPCFVAQWSLVQCKFH